ncbi:MAG: alpha/beta hydrolase [Bacteroidota bacterium]
MKYIVLLAITCLVPNWLNAQARFVKVDSAELWVNTIGLEDRQADQAVLVLESGLGTPMGHWDSILDGIAELAPVVVYDRPGIGQSKPIEELPTIENVADRLVRMLRQLEIAPPYVLVGHSLGGLYVRGFANHYPELLAGLVIIDPADFTETHENKRSYYEVLNWEAAKVDSLIQSFIDKRAAWSTKAPPSIQREGQVLSDIRAKEFDTIIGSKLPNIPVHIITGGRFDLPKRLWSKAYDEEALFRSKMKHRTQRWITVVQSVDKGMFLYSGDAGHFVHRDDPELVISSIRMVLQDYDLLRADKD